MTTTTTTASAELRFIVSHIEHILDSIITDKDLDRKVGAYRFVHALEQMIVDVDSGSIEHRAAIKLAAVSARRDFTNSAANRDGIEAARQMAVATAAFFGRL